MSKLLAMMMKPKPIMYATIKGSLTESPAGVFSGFSASNYLQIQEMLDLTSNFEIEICITPSTVSLSSGAISTFIGGSFTFGISANYSGKLTAYIRNSNNDYIINGSQGQRIFVADTQYLVKLKQTKTNNIYNILISSSNDNGTSWLTEYNANSNYPIKHDTLLNLCSAGNSSYPQQYLRGSIDLNNSYIKLGSTKYNLQAVVGYTIVGSPTITDGVVSGFSDSNYLELQQLLDVGTKDFEIKGTFTANSISQTRLFCTNGYSTSFSGIILNNNSDISSRFYINNDTTVYIISSTKCQVNTKTYVIMYRKGNVIGIKVSTDNINWSDNTQNINSTDVITLNNFKFIIGANIRSTTQYLNGSIDMNNTYIKINNKLWFNGQPA